jgi:NADPH-dependent glutamate synthase beta subunit-like oxidoreductase
MWKIMPVTICLLVELQFRAGFKRVAREREVVWSFMLGNGADDPNPVKRPYRELSNCVERKPYLQQTQQYKGRKAKE